MVSEQMDMLDEDHARPDSDAVVTEDTVRRIELVSEIAENGEAIVGLTDGRTVEIHGHDAHFFPYEGVVMTESESDSELWIFAEEIVSVERH